LTNNRIAAQGRDPSLKRVGAAGKQLARLRVERRQRLRRPGQRLLVVGRFGAEIAVAVAARGQPRQAQDSECEAAKRPAFGLPAHLSD